MQRFPKGVAASSAISSDGLKFEGDSGSSSARKLGDSVDIKGDSNITTIGSGDGVDIALNKNLDLGGSGSLKTGNSTVNTSGLTITGGPNVTVAGIDADGKKITKVGSGNISATSTDGVNGANIYEQLLGETSGGIRYFHANSKADDSEANGQESVAIGPLTKAQGASSLAAGDGALTTAEGEGAIALGQNAVAGGAGPGDGGAGAIAVGRSSTASGSSATALGDGAQASAGNATALGAGAEASGGNSIALGQSTANAGNTFAAGNGAVANSPDSISLGTGAGVGTSGTVGDDQRDHVAIGRQAGRNVTGRETIGIGFGAGSNVKGDNNTAIGTNAGTGITGEYNIAMGFEANKNAGVINHSTVVGGNASAGSNSVALGYLAKANNSESVALGDQAEADAQGLALGANTKAEGNSVALGFNSHGLASDLNGPSYLTGVAADTVGGVVSVGNTSTSFTRRIVNVADGAQGNDAVNVNQLKGAQRSVANLVGGGVLLNTDGSYGKIKITDTNNVEHEFNTVVDALQAAGNGSIVSLPPEAVQYNSDGTIDVVAGTLDGQAVNLGQLNAAIAEDGVKYFSVDSTDLANRSNDGATGTNAMAIGPQASATGDESLSLGYQALSNAGNSTAIGNDVSAGGVRSTVLGNESHVYGENGVAIGHDVESNGKNSLVMGTGAKANDNSTGERVDNAIVIGTEAKSTASEDGIAIGRTALASEDRGVAQGFNAESTADDAMAFGSSSRASGVSAQASGTGASASSVNAQASGTGASASGLNSIAQGTRAKGYATDGIAMGTDAEAGFDDPNNLDRERNTAGIAIGKKSLADEEHALALGVEAKARAKRATAVGDGASATGMDALAMGTGAGASEQDATAIGRKAAASAQDATAFGRDSIANKQDAIAFGRGAESSEQGAMALGQGAKAKVNKGDVALGAGSVTGAVVNTPRATVDKNIYNYAGANATSTVSVGTKDNERTVTHVAAGRVSATSTDAINGSQLFGTNKAVDALGDDLDTAGKSVADSLGGGSSYDQATHEVTASLNVNGDTYTNVESAIQYAAQGWDVQVNGTAADNVAPGETVQFVDGKNIKVTRDDDQVIKIATADDVEFTDLKVTNTTQLGDSFTVNADNSVKYTGSITDGDHITNKTYVDKVGAASKTVVAGGTNIAGVDETIDPTTGASTYTVNADGASVSKGSDAVTVTKGTKDPITNVTDYAVDLSQGTKDDIANANKGWNIATSDTKGTSTSNVAPSSTVDFVSSDDNIHIGHTRDDTTGNTSIDFALGHDLTVGGKDGVDGKIAVNGKDGVSGVTINGEDGSIGLTGPAGADGTPGASGTISVVDGVPGVDGKDGITRIVIDDVEVATMDDGLKFAGNTGNAIAKKLNDTLNIEGELGDTKDASGANLRVDSKDGKLNLVMAKNLTDLESITINDGGPVINGSGIDMGGLDVDGKPTNKITNLAPGTDGTDAVNLDQLTDVEATANAGWNVKTTDTDATGSSNVAPKANVDFVSSDDNIAITHTRDGSGDTEIDFALGHELSIGGDGEDGYIGVDGKDGKTNVAIDGSDGSIGLAGPTGKDGTDGLTKITVGTGKPGLDGKDGVTRIVYTDPDGDEKEVATMDDGLNFAGNKGDTIAKQLNETMKIRGGMSDMSGKAATGKNIRTVGKNGELVIQMSRNLIDLDSITINDGGPVIDSSGIDMGGNTIANLAPGVDGKDAVNVDQLEDVKTTANAGWNVETTDADATVSNVAPSKKVDFVSSDNNVNISHTQGADGNTEIDFALGNDIQVGGPSEPGEPGKDGTIGVNGADGVSGVVINGKDGTIGLTGADGINGTIGIKGTDGAPGLDGTDGTRLVIDDKEVATMEDGLKFAGNTGDTIAKKLNETLNIEGELADADDASGANLRVGSKDGKLNLVMAKNLTDLDSITINNGGPVISSTGIDMGGLDGDGKPTNKITNLAPGTDGTDAVNLDQLEDLDSSLTNKGLNFAGNTGPGFNTPLGETVNIVGRMQSTESGAASGRNIRTVAKDNGELVIQMSRDLIDLDSIKIDGGGPVINKDGIDMGNNKITNLAPGEISKNSTDGVNGGQLWQVRDTANAGWNLTTGGEVGSLSNVAPRDTVDFSGDGNVLVSNINNDVSVELADIITLGDDDENKVTVDGVEGKISVGEKVTLDKTGLIIADGGPSMTIGGIYAGDKQITGVASGLGGQPLDQINGDDLLNAVNVGDLQKVAGDIGNDVAAAKTVVTEGKNIKVTESKGDNGESVYEVATSDEVEFDKMEVGTVTIDKDNVDGDGNTIIAGVGKGEVSADSTDAINGSQLHQVKNDIGDINTSLDGGLDFAADEGDPVNRKLGETVGITGDDNITTKTTGDGVQVTLNRELNVDSVTTGKTTVSNTGVTIEGGPSMTQGGIDAGGKVITNVAAGRAPTDAANVGQLQNLNQRFTNEINGVHNRIDEVERDANAGIAGVAAMGNAPYVPGKFTYHVGGGYHGGESAVGVNFRRTADNGRWSLTAGAAGSRAGATISLGVSGVID